MSRLPRTSIALGLAAIVLTAFVPSATAALSIELTPAGTITKKVEAFTIRTSGGEVTVTCFLLLRGQISSSIDKAAARTLPGGRIGQIIAAEAVGCRTGLGTEAEVTVLTSAAAPISLRYDGFRGALPEITGIIFHKLGFGLEVVDPLTFGACLFRGPVNLVLTVPPVEGGPAGRFNPESFQTPNMLPNTGGLLCPESVTISGAGRVQIAQIAILVG